MSVRNTQAFMKHFQSISEEVLKHLKKPLHKKVQFQMSYHISKKYSSISEAFFKHFQSISEDLLKHF
jgi:hypothetical protein